MPTRMQRFEILLSAALRASIREQAHKNQETESEFIRTAIEERLAQLTGKSIASDIEKAVRNGLSEQIQKTERFVYQALFEELRFTETYLPWIIELLITALYDKATPAQIQRALDEHERKSRIAAGAATRRKKWVPEHVLQANTEEETEAGLPQPDDVVS